MEEEQRQRFANGYRRMPDEELARLLAESHSLTDEARQALIDVVDERPDPAAIRATAEDRAAVRNASPPAERPGLGFWLGFLVFGFCMAPLRAIGQTSNQFAVTEGLYPQLLEMDSWKTYKGISWLLVASVAGASIIAVIAITKGTRHRDRNRVLAALWFNALGITVLDLVATAFLFGWETVREAFADPQANIQSVVAVVFASIWSAYLTMSDRCKRRYPARGAEADIPAVFS
jgi:hypothetical protein